MTVKFNLDCVLNLHNKHIYISAIQRDSIEDDVAFKRSLVQINRLDIKTITKMSDGTARITMKNNLLSIETVENATYEDANRVAQAAMDAYKKGEVDEVNLVYTQFISALSQEPTIVKLLPVTIEPKQGEEIKKAKCAVQYLPSADAVLGYVLPKYVSGSVYGAIAESFASEQAARRTAMESATDNANEMIAKLELSYNRARQAAVTQEISEIVGGAAASAK
jgi:ATP synthase F1 gamma subunit